MKKICLKMSKNWVDERTGFSDIFLPNFCMKKFLVVLDFLYLRQCLHVFFVTMQIVTEFWKLFIMYLPLIMLIPVLNYLRQQVCRMGGLSMAFIIGRYFIYDHCWFACVCVFLFGVLYKSPERWFGSLVFY